MARIIVNADDFGLDVGTNDAIQLGFEGGLISSTTLLANRSGFDDAIQRIQQEDIPKNAVGIHLNLTQGKPLTNGIVGEPRFCRDGDFHGEIRRKPVLYLSSSEKINLRLEVSAQIQKILAAGIKPTHLDGHHHIHSEWAIFQCNKKNILDSGINRIRLSRTSGIHSSGMKGVLKRLYKFHFNRWLRLSGFSTTNRMGEFTDFFKAPLENQIVEIMTHFVRDASGNYNLDGIAKDEYRLLAKAFNEKNNLISFHSL
jgi:predicted glycoside hydrolase/deacetylase ChbG (UPF0249 family)